MACLQQNELRSRAIDMLQNLMRLTNEEIGCLIANDTKRLLELDKELEGVFGGKERAFGALREHIEEHGC